MEYRRRTIQGVLEITTELRRSGRAVPKCCDAVEEPLAGLDEPSRRVDCKPHKQLDQRIGYGVGMSPEQVAAACAPSISFKSPTQTRQEEPLSGYKGVGLTFLAYGTDE